MTPACVVCRKPVPAWPSGWLRTDDGVDYCPAHKPDPSDLPEVLGTAATDSDGPQPCKWPGCDGRHRHRCQVCGGAGEYGVRECDCAQLEAIEAARIKPYYVDDLVTIYNTDCLRLVSTVAWDVMVTDPPYGIGWKRGVNHARGSKQHAGIANDEDTSVRDQVLMLASAMGKPAVVFGSFYAPQPQHTKQVLVWHKPADAGVVGSTTGYRRDAEPIFLVGPWPQRTVEWPSVLRSAEASIAAVAAKTGHPHTKPVDLMRTLLGRTEGVILDPFMGSGSTLVAAKELGRKAIGIELDERYCETAARRLSHEVMQFGEAS